MFKILGWAGTCRKLSSLRIDLWQDRPSRGSNILYILFEVEGRLLKDYFLRLVLRLSPVLIYSPLARLLLTYFSHYSPLNLDTLLWCWWLLRGLISLKLSSCSAETAILLGPANRKKTLFLSRNVKIAVICLTKSATSLSLNLFPSPWYSSKDVSWWSKTA